MQPHTGDNNHTHRRKL